MAKQDYPYPEDEFDTLGADRVPQGVHRTPVPRWRRLLPFVVVLLVAPTLAYLGVSYLANQGSPSSSETSAAVATTEPTPSETADEGTPTEEPSAAPSETEPTPTETPTEDADIQRGAAVFILNGAGVAGLAGQATGKLEADGFTDVTPADYASSVPTASTVYYNNPDLQATAEQVGTLLGITALRELATATDSIAVVLRGDYVP